ncbi:uncharacterized protein [Palaemon carinicauda]|uniref:uncharacterized protein n=1 Tax=Palaemon carinicauda TaxID=392227 RepID=UPI0035B5CFCC
MRWSWASLSLLSLHVLTKRIYKERKMKNQFLLSIAVALVMSTCALPAGPQPSRIAAIENAFNDRTAVEAIISCFMGKSECTLQQKEIKARAIATMLNFGSCPRKYCSPEESAEMERSMELLQSKHPDLWTQLIFSILGIDIKDFGRRR